MRNQNTRTLAQLAILIALLAVLTFTPIGFIMVPPVSITLMHIPVIVGAMLMGPKQGGVLGLAFGLFSMIKASTAAASPVDMAFSPFLSGEPVASLVLCLLPRVLLGVVAGLLYGLLSRKMKGDAPAMAVTAVVSSFFHTAAVMGLLWVVPGAALEEHHHDGGQRQQPVGGVGRRHFGYSRVQSGEADIKGILTRMGNSRGAAIPRP